MHREWMLTQLASHASGGRRPPDSQCAAARISCHEPPHCPNSWTRKDGQAPGQPKVTGTATQGALNNQPQRTLKHYYCCMASSSRAEGEGTGSYPFLQGRSNQQLSFVNNLLTTLALAVIAYAAAASTDPSKLHVLGWRRPILGIALVSLAVSLLLGLGLAVNRMQVFRISARIARIRQLRDRLGPKGDYETERLHSLSLSLIKWSCPGHITRRRARIEAKEPACKLAQTTVFNGVVDQDVLNNIKSCTDALLAALRRWTDRADALTWLLIRLQTLAFLAGSILLLVVPLTYYF
jgi:hypothetical protein